MFHKLKKVFTDFYKCWFVGLTYYIIMKYKGIKCVKFSNFTLNFTLPLYKTTELKWSTIFKNKWFLTIFYTEMDGDDKFIRGFFLSVIKYVKCISISSVKFLVWNVKNIRKINFSLYNVVLFYTDVTKTKSFSSSFSNL